MAVRLLVAGMVAISLAGAAATTPTLVSAQADHELIAFTTDRASNLRRFALFSVRENGTRHRLVDLWPRGFPSFVLSPGGKRILFVRSEGGSSALFIASRTGANARRLTPTEVAPIPSHGLAFSPDGSWIAFAGYGHCDGCSPDGRIGVFVVRSDATHLRRVAVDGRHPAWSPDGRRLAYTGDAYRGPTWSVFVVGLDGRRARRVGRGARPVWAPDGIRVAYTAVGQRAPRRAFCVATVRRPGRHCVDGPRPRGLSWSPTGRHIALLGGYRARTRLAVVRPDGRGLRVVTRSFRGGVGWSPDGRRIAYYSLDPGEHRIYVRSVVAKAPAKLLARESPQAEIGCCRFRRGRIEYTVRLSDNDHELAVMNPDGRGFRALTDNFADELTPAWSPDAGTIAYARRTIDYSRGEPTSTGTALWSIRADGTGDRQLTSPRGWHDTSPTWSPDGRSIAFVRGPVNGLSVLMILNLDDGSVRPLGVPWSPATVSWSPNGEWIVAALGDSLGFIRPDRTGSYSIFVGSLPFSPTWAPDGSRLAFGAGGDLFSMRPDGSDRFRIAQRAGAPAAWSPDVRRVVFTRPSRTDPAESDLWVANAAGGGEVQLTDDPSSNLAPAWRP